MPLQKSATLSPTAWIKQNGVDNVEELLASHGHPFTNHMLQQQPVRLPCNFCRRQGPKPPPITVD